MNDEKPTVRRVSASAFSVLDCGYRYAMEYAVGRERALAWGFPWCEDRTARERGIIYHQVAETVAKGLMHGQDMGVEEIRALCMALKDVDAGLCGEIAAGVTWWAQRMAGVKPVAVEEDGGRWTMTRGGVEIVGKFDVKHIADEGMPICTDFKSGFIPDKDAAKKTTQNRLYAWQIMEADDAPVVGVSMVSLGNRFSFLLEYTREDVEQYRPYLERDIAKVHEAMVLVAAATTDGAKKALLTRSEFAPRLHGWCPSCPVRWACDAYGTAVWKTGPKAEGLTCRAAAVERLRLVDKFLNAEKNKIENDLKAEAMDSPVVEGGYVARVKTREDQIAAKPATVRTINTLVIERDDAVAEPKGREGRDEVPQEAGRGRSRALGT
jgi:hypothetical protein